MILKALLASLVVAAALVRPAGAEDFTDAVARRMVAKATSQVAAGKYVKGDQIRSSLIGRQFSARVPGKSGIRAVQFYSTSYTVSTATGYQMFDWKVARDFFCFKPRDHKAFSCRHRLVTLTSGTVLVGRSASDGLAMKIRIKAVQ